MNDPAPHITLVEDTPSLAAMYETALRNDGYQVTALARGQETLDYLEDNAPDLLLLDLNLPDVGGLEILAVLQERRCKTPVIVITGHGSINNAVEAMRKGACDFLVKPFSIERLRTAVKTELEKNPYDTMPAELAGLPADRQDDALPPAAPAPPPHKFGKFIGTSPIMQKIYEQIAAAARSNATVFITGESGTGKEVCAEAIHQHSPRAGKPFVPINCAAIPRDLMESELFGHVKGAFTGAIADRAGAAKLADGGTLFLDEIAEMNPDMQTKLLRFLQNLTFQKVGGSKPEKTDVRIICATNRNPVEEIRAGNFREDLFYRLHVLPLYMPPLRDRGSDITDIAQTLLRHYSDEESKSFEGFDDDAEQALLHYRWPGNIRQLQNTIRRIVVMYDSHLITAAMLPPDFLQDSGASLAEKPGAVARHTFPAASAPDPITNGAQNGRGTIRPLADIEREIIEHAIATCGGNIPRAAAALEISPSTIYRKKAVWERNQRHEKA